MVSGEERCLPAWTMRRSEGLCRLVRRARRERRVRIEVFEGMVSGIAARRQCQFFVRALFGSGCVGMAVVMMSG